MKALLNVRANVTQVLSERYTMHYLCVQKLAFTYRNGLLGQ